MIDTTNSKPGHHEKGSYVIGSGPTVIVILGSCRVLPYVNYFDWMNTDNRFTIHLINVVNFCFDEAGNGVDSREFTKRFEDNTYLRAALSQCNWFIHEHTENFGMFNTSEAAPVNIYQFGMQPQIDVGIPNWHNHWIMAQELVNFDPAMKAFARGGGLNDPELGGAMVKAFKENGEAEIARFLGNCAQTDLPEFGGVFQAEWRAVRYFWSGNHISNRFTAAVFRLMNDKYLKLEISQEFWDRVFATDMYSTPATPVTKYDVENYGLTWPGPVVDLVIP